MKHLERGRSLGAGLFLPLALTMFLMVGCAHYTVNKPLERYSPSTGYRAKNVRDKGKCNEMLLMVSFSGGGTRAAAFSYGVLEALRNTRVSINGRTISLLDEVDVISAVSGGSFTAAYYGVFGDRIFDEFEERFLKKNIQGALTRRIFLNPYNWMRLSSSYFDRSDIAAEYYDEAVFRGATFGDMIKHKGPMVFINATDMVLGTRIAFTQDAFDTLCSDITDYPVARACAASSAVPILLSPITLKNYAGQCGYRMPRIMELALEERALPDRRFDLANNYRPYLDSKETPYIHLVDGGVADNLGLRALLERVITAGDAWDTIKNAANPNVHKIVFIVVNAETEVNRGWSLTNRIPSIGAMVESYSSIAISRYNVETVALLRESFPRWAEEIRRGRCGEGRISTEPGSCGDIEYYLVEVKFNALRSDEERSFFTRLPTSFKLEPEQVDRLKESAQRILFESREFKRLLTDLKEGSPSE